MMLFEDKDGRLWHQDLIEELDPWQIEELEIGASSLDGTAC